MTNLFQTNVKAAFTYFNQNNKNRLIHKQNEMFSCSAERKQNN